MTENKYVLEFVEKYRDLMTPDEVVWVDGSKEQHKLLTCEAIAVGEVIKLSNSLMPGCLYHRTDENDVARVEDRTFICSKNEEDAGITNHWMDPTKAYELLDGIAQGAMKGRTMYVIPYSMGKIGSPFARYGIELTDSLYVVLNMMIMTRVSDKVLERIDGDDFVKGIHSKVDLNPDNKYICHFPEDNTIYSLNSGYGGNVLLGKKCFALRIASYQGWKQGWMAEHMLILGVEKPDGDVKYICAAFPSACGKTNLAMLVPPESYREKGYKIWTVGDDIAWIRKKNGKFYAINPENGFFGVVPGTNADTNPNALATMRRNTIFTNVCFNAKNNTVWWEGSKMEPPTRAYDWRGRSWNVNMKDEEGKPIKGAHPNSRFTAPAKNCPCLSKEFDNGRGVEISAFIFGGRRASLAPLVYEARDWEHGVFVGATMASETTAAIQGKTGVVRRDPMAMLPFCGYNMCDYFDHWFKMGQRVADPPKFFHVNWFRTDENGNYLWNGFGDNMRVLDWILKRCEGIVEGKETPIGIVPKKDELDLTGMENVDEEKLEKLLAVDGKQWKKEAAEISAFFDGFGDKLPEKLRKQLRILKSKLREAEI